MHADTRVIEHTWIPLSDGTRLAARIWLPADAERRPVPALLEYIPYRKNDGTARRDSLRHPYLAAHGYAAVRVDMRGSGDSDGLMLDEYARQEQDDALEVIAWLAEQPWCTGAVGLFGKSWGGFNALQIAARRPPALKAIITIYSTDDRYADDVHYMGGCVLGSDMLAWAAVMLAYNAQPPDPKVLGDAWRQAWLERMEGTPPFVEEWLRHQRRDAYWKHGSVCEDFGQIECAVLAVGGWADAYTNAVPRLLAGLSCPRRGLIGPWAHEFPEVATPAPAIGFLQESLRWWDHWLKGADTGVMGEPMLRAWVQDAIAPSTTVAERPGRWVAEETWPSPRIAPRALHLAPGGALLPNAPQPPLADAPPVAGPVQTHGLDAGVWCAYGQPGDYAPDQRAEDGASLCFTSAPLAEPQDILGFPELTLQLSADRPRALVAVRLCDVAPDGASLLVSRGLLNLTHRDGHERPAPVVPGERVTVTVRLNVAGHRLAAGHRWRVAVSPTYWPQAWPSPEPAALTVYAGRLELPARPPSPADERLAPFAPPATSAALAVEVLRTGERRRSVLRDHVTGAATLEDVQDGGRWRIAGDGLTYDHLAVDRFRIVEGNPLSARAESEHAIAIGRGSWQTRVQTSSAMTGDMTHFHLTNTLEAFEGDARVFAKTWSCAIPRDHV